MEVNDHFIVTCPTCRAVVVDVEPEGVAKLGERDMVFSINELIATHAITHIEAAMDVKYTFCPTSDITVQMGDIWMQVLDVLVNKLHLQPDEAKRLIAEASGRGIAKGQTDVKAATAETTMTEDIKLDQKTINRKIKDNMEKYGITVEDG